MIRYLKALFGAARRRHCRARSRRGVSSSPFDAKPKRDRNLSCVTTLVHSSSLQSSTTYKTMDYSTPTTDSSIQVYKVSFMPVTGLMAIAQESANSQGIAGDDSCSFDQDDASINTISNDESEATF
ncbi:hypothetical protein MRB53_030625 [Persea americana]|uniref:Uncharacterized protein n=1 Tax=Persea americana TaxID=3435 RepID=A0ACC2KLV0_PERAE|nr:hypothetical protein MRB53_030625 [Persea americana]